MTDYTRFDNLVVKDCWTYVGPLSSKGYGRWMSKRKERAAHVVAYERWIGPIPEGMQVDHLCFNRACVNPAHLELVTPQENQKRRRPRKTCKNGHPLCGDNWMDPPKGTTRCRVCWAALQIQQSAQRRERYRTDEAYRAKAIERSKQTYARRRVTEVA